MNAKAVVTASMIYVGVLALIANDWLGALRRTVQTLSGSAE